MNVEQNMTRINKVYAVLKKPLRLKVCLIMLIVSNLLSQPVFSDEPEHIRQSVRALGMGGAFVAVANDEYALYYNPAGLRSVQQTIVEIVTVGATTNQNLLDLQDVETSNTTATFGDLVGKNVYTEINMGAMSITAPGWGYSIFGNLLFNSIINNPQVPYFEMKAYYQYGMVGGFALSFMDEILDVGIAMKSITRNGITKTVHVYDLLDDDFADNLEKEFVERNIITHDIGVTYHLDQIANLETRVSYVIRNIGGMDFGSAGQIPMTMDVGIATETEIAGLDFIFAIDYVDLANKLTQYQDYLRNLKAGAEVGCFKRSNGHHALSLRLGLNASHYLSAGFSINIPGLPIKIDYAAWSEEIGFLAGKIEDKRQSANVSINF